MNTQISSQNLFGKILSQHGRETVQILRKAERIGAKISSWRNHRTFNLRCLKSNVTPPSVKLVSNVQGARAEQILKKAEKDLLEVRIRHCNFTLDKLRIEEENLIAELSTKLPEVELRLSKDFLAERKQLQFERVKKRQRDKFTRLKVKNQLTNARETAELTEIQERWVVNKSSKVLDPVSTSLLRKGLNFAITPKRLPTEEIITSTEIACKKLDPQTAASLRSEVARSVQRKKVPTPNVPREEVEALTNLKKDDSIIILPADKGRATVILDKKEYEEKASKILEDKKTYEILKKDPTNTFKNKLINILKTMNKEGNISQILYRQLYPTSYQAPRFYGLPKIHKPDMPLRPIVSGIGSITE